MNQTLRSRLARIEKSQGNPIDRMTEEELEERLAELMPAVRAEVESMGGKCDGLSDHEVYDLALKLNPNWLNEGDR